MFFLVEESTNLKDNIDNNQSCGWKIHVLIQSKFGLCLGMCRNIGYLQYPFVNISCMPPLMEIDDLAGSA